MPESLFQQRCFPVNFAKFLRTPFLQGTSGSYFYLARLNAGLRGLHNLFSRKKHYKLIFFELICERIRVSQISFTDC